MHHETLLLLVAVQISTAQYDNARSGAGTREQGLTPAVLRPVRRDVS
jgi:hypothetical protein